MDHDDISGIISEATEILTSFSVPLYIDDDRKRPMLFATGFFVNTGPRVFLVSAAHVFDRWAAGHLIYYYIRPGVTRTLTGQLVSTPGRNNRASDPLDVGCLLLSGEDLPPYPDVSKFALDIAYLAPRRLPRRGREYITIGFPATKARVDNRKSTTLAAPYGYRSSSIDDDKYHGLQLNPDTHIVLPFDPRRGFDASGKRCHFPKPNGMSGAPVIVLFEDVDNPMRVFPVVGVAIEHRTRDKVLIATDIRFAIDAMMHAPLAE